ncbi:MAG: helix-turn-helix domain-containing protein, partial [Patescibacteria group bacterium]
MKKIIINLKDLRKAKELTQQELAENLGVSRQSVIAVETGKFLPSIELALDIANFF